MIKFIDHDAEYIANDTNSSTEEKYNMEKENLISIGKMRIDQLYEKKMKLIEREKAK